MDIAEEKAKIRKEIRRKRSFLSSGVLADIDKELPDFIFSIEDEELQSKISGAKRIALYWAVNGEVPTDGLAKAFMAKGITCCYPRIKDGAMEFCDCRSLSAEEFETGAFGIKEPVSSKSAVAIGDIDVVVLPALAYNEEGTRLGAGGGYYDRYFGVPENERPYLLGICYEFQICSDVPFEDTDISADFIAVIPEEVYGD